MEQKEKLVIVQAVCSAFAYLKKNPNASIEEVMAKAMKSADASKMNLPGIAAVNSLFKYLQENPKAEEKKAIQHVMNHLPEIIKSIEQQEIDEKNHKNHVEEISEEIKLEE